MDKRYPVSPNHIANKKSAAALLPRAAAIIQTNEYRQSLDCSIWGSFKYNILIW